MGAGATGQAELVTCKVTCSTHMPPSRRNYAVCIKLSGYGCYSMVCAEQTTTLQIYPRTIHENNAMLQAIRHCTLHLPA